MSTRKRGRCSICSKPRALNGRGLVTYHTVADPSGDGGHSCEGTGRPPVVGTGATAILRGAVLPLPVRPALDPGPRTPPRTNCPRCKGKGYIPGLLYQERCTLCDPGAALRMVPWFRTST